MPPAEKQLKNSTRCRFTYWADKLVSCPFCSERLTLEEYRSDHSKSVHRLDEDEICIFCRDFVFRDPKSYEEIAHRDACSKLFIEQQKQKVDPVDAVKRQAVYNRRNHFKDRSMTCPQCHEEMTFAEYEKHHARDAHGLSCIYCDDDGAHDTTRCFHEFVDRNLMPPEAPPDDPETDDLIKPPMTSAIRDDPPVLCGCISYDPEPHRRQMDGRRYAPRFANFYEDYPRYSSELRDTGSLPVFSDESGLGEEAPALFRMFLSGEWKFYHIYVRRYGYAKFLQEMPESLVVSRFWCLCDCGMNSAKLHRHMIIATRNFQQLKTAWGRVRVPRHRVVKYMKRIESALHLAYTILYVSSKKRKCKSWGVRRRHVRINAHFYINRPLHPHAVMAMCTLWSGGLTEWLKRRNGGKSVLDWNLETSYDHHGNEKFRVRILEIMPRNKHCPVPLRWELFLSSLEPDPRGTLRMHWFEGEEMLVGETEDAAPNYVDFMKHQVVLGNSAKKRMQDKWYTLNKTQVAQANLIQIMKLRQDVKDDALRVKDVELQVRDEKIRDLEHEMNQQNVDFRRETRELWQELTEVKLENTELRQKVLRDVELGRENVDLKREITELRQRELRDLRREIADLRRENAELKQRCQINVHSWQGNVNN